MAYYKKAAVEEVEVQYILTRCTGTVGGILGGTTGGRRHIRWRTIKRRQSRK